MQKLLTVLTLSISASLVAGQAFAAPEHAQHQQTHQQTTQQKHIQHNNSQHNAQHNTGVKRAAAQQWKAGNKFPAQFRGAGYKVDYKHHKQLSKPGKNQQWFKADNRYILVNTATYSIIKVLGL